MNKYQEALKNIKREAGTPYFSTLYDIDDWKDDFNTLQELVDKETPLTPEYKKTYVGREHYLDKDYLMLYHCPKCDGVIYPIQKHCDSCGQKLDWNKYYVIEEKHNGRTYYKRSDTDE